MMQHLLNSTYCNFFHRFSRCFDNFLEFIQTIDAKKESRLKTLTFFKPCSNFLSKSDKKVIFGKSVRLQLKSMKKGFGRNFDHSRASWDPIKQQKSQKKRCFFTFEDPRQRKQAFFGRKFRCAHFGPCQIKKRIFRSLALLGNSNGGY